jgi:hypothetical protein
MSTRNLAAGLLGLIGVLVVVVGTFLPIVEYVGGLDSASGWGDGLNDGPIHLIVALVPLAAALVILRNRAATWVKVVLIVGALIGFFWVFVRFADISGSLEEGELADLVAAATDPGFGLYVIIVGWALVLVAGLVAKAVKRPVSGAF